MGRPSKYPAELRERAVRLVFEQQGSHESQWATIVSVAEKLGCSTEALRKGSDSASATRASALA